MTATTRSRHVCATYRTNAELVTVASSFLAEGLMKGEQCWYVGKGAELRALRRALGALGVHVDAATRQSALKILTASDVYSAIVPFSPERVMSLFSDGISNALKDGFNGFRAAGEMSWIDGAQWSDQLVEYEHLITTLLTNSNGTGLCLYRADSPHVAQAIDAHPLLVSAHGSFVPNERFVAKAISFKAGR